MARPCYENGGETEVRMRQNLSEESYPEVDFENEGLPVVPNPARGHHYYVELSPSGIDAPSAIVGAVPDSGADAPTISSRCVDRVVYIQRAQHQLEGRAAGAACSDGLRSDGTGPELLRVHGKGRRKEQGGDPLRLPG